MVFIILGGGHEKKKNNVDKDNLDRPYYGLQINEKLDLEKNWRSLGRWWSEYCHIKWTSGTENKIKDNKEF